VELFEQIRRDAARMRSETGEVWIRALALLHETHRRTVRLALGSAVPPQKRSRTRSTNRSDSSRASRLNRVTQGRRRPAPQRASEVNSKTGPPGPLDAVITTTP
jgi:hypothetical protein